jgi:uncharacterized protein (TIGR02996 family)
MNRLYLHREVRAFLQEAKARPEDDAARLVLADWLEEHEDHDRADFIRLQCRPAHDTGPSLAQAERTEPQERADALVARHGGCWLGPLWLHGYGAGDWHRGLLSARPDRRATPDELADILPWVDAVCMEVTGHEAFARAVDLANSGPFNHLAFHLRQPFREDLILHYLAQVEESSALRSLTFRWPPGLARRDPEPGGKAVLAVGEGFVARLLGLPVAQHLTHLASGLALPAGHAGLLPAAGIEPVVAWPCNWTHHLPPACFQARREWVAV